MDFIIPIHILKPNKAMKAKGFTEEEENVNIQVMSTGKFAVFPSVSMQRSSPYPYAVFKSLGEIKENFQVVHSTNPQLLD